jgi:Family of unknown function (DUF6056)
MPFNKSRMSIQTLLKNKHNFWTLIASLALGVGFYIQYQFNLFLDDDYLYALFTGTDRPIASISDALHSQAIEYMEHNGRFVIHTIVNMFCGVWGVTLFGVFNTLMFVVFFWFTFKLALNNLKEMYLKGFLFVLFLWLFIPVQGVTFLGNIAFSVNYLWASVATFGFLLMHQKTSIEIGHWWQSIFLLVFGVFIGSLQESFSVGIAGSLFIYYYFHRKELRGKKLFLVLGYLLGALIIVGAPGNFNRMEGEQTGVWDSGLKMLVLIKWSHFRNMFFHIPILVILLGTIILMFLRNKPFALQFIRKNQLYLVAILINLLFSLLIAYKGQWQITSSALFAIIMLSNLIFEKWEKEIGHYRKYLIAGTAAILISTYIPALNLRKKLYNEHQKLIECARTTRNGIAWGNYEVIGHDFQKRYNFLENYFRVVFYMGDDYHKRLLSDYLTRGKNPKLVTCVLPFSPDEINAFCTVENQQTSNNQLFKAGKYPFFIIRADSTAKRRHSMDKLNELQNTPIRKTILSGLGCEEYKHKGMFYAVIYYR